MARTFNQDVIHLRKLKVKNTEAGTRKSAADKAFKQQQTHVLRRMEMEDIEAIKSGGTLFSRVVKVKGSVDDRSEYVRWALDNDEGLQEFMAARGLDDLDGKAELYEVITGLAMLSLKESGDLCNQQARAHVDDGEPLPPGLTFRPDDYVSQRTA